MNEFDENSLLNKIKANEKKSQIVLTVAILVSVFLGVLTLYYANRLRDMTKIAEQSEQLAVDQKMEFEENRDKLLKALDSLTILVQKLQDPGNVSKELKEAIKISKKTGYMIYIHYKTENGKTLSEKLEKELINANYNVASVKQISDPIGQNDIRYYYEDDEKTANEIKKIAENIGIQKLIMKGEDYFDYKKAPKQLIEIWLNL